MIDELKKDTNDDSYPIECVIESSSGVTINANTVLTARTYYLGNQVDSLGELYEYTWYRDKKSGIVIGRGKTLRVTPAYAAKYSRWEILSFYVVVTEPEQVIPSKMETTTPTVSKKEIVEVPKFVADWIEKRKDDFKSSYDAVIYLESCGWDDEAHVEYKVYEWLPENLLTFCKAWELGYTIEQPKLLTVIVKDYDKTIMSKQLPEDEVNKMMGGLESE